MGSEPFRVMLFYDGSYFKKGQIYFRYGEKRGWFSLPGWHTLIERYVAAKAKLPVDITKLVAAHFYDGRMTTTVAQAMQLEKDRDFELALMSAGVIPHYLPLREQERPGSTAEEPKFQVSQKGVDVNIAIDALDWAHADRYDVAVLVTGDEDFVPLVRRITSLGKQTLLAHFTIDPWTDEKMTPHKGTFASRALVDAVTWSLNVNQLVKDPDWKTEVKGLFFMPKGAGPGGGPTK